MVARKRSVDVPGPGFLSFFRGGEVGRQEAPLLVIVIPGWKQNLISDTITQHTAQVRPQNPDN